MGAASEPQNIQSQLVDQPLSYEPENSRIAWKETKEGIVLLPRVSLEGPVRQAVVEVRGFLIELRQEGYSTWWSAEAVVPFSRQELFTVIVPASLRIRDAAGTLRSQNLAWQQPPFVPPTMAERYTAAQRSLPAILNVMTLARSIYAGFFVFFSLAFIALVVIEIRKQHPHIILQTLSLLGLLVILSVT